MFMISRMGKWRCASCFVALMLWNAPIQAQPKSLLEIMELPDALDSDENAGEKALYDGIVRQGRIFGIAHGKNFRIREIRQEP